MECHPSGLSPHWQSLLIDIRKAYTDRSIELDCFNVKVYSVEYSLVVFQSEWLPALFAVSACTFVANRFMCTTNVSLKIYMNNCSRKVLSRFQITWDAAYSNNHKLVDTSNFLFEERQTSFTPFLFHVKCLKYQSCKLTAHLETRNTFWLEYVTTHVTLIEWNTRGNIFHKCSFFDISNEMLWFSLSKISSCHS